MVGVAYRKSRPSSHRASRARASLGEVSERTRPWVWWSTYIAPPVQDYQPMNEEAEDPFDVPFVSLGKTHVSIAMTPCRTLVNALISCADGVPKCCGKEFRQSLEGGCVWVDSRMSGSRRSFHRGIVLPGISRPFHPSEWIDVPPESHRYIWSLSITAQSSSVGL